MIIILAAFLLVTAFYALVNLISVLDHGHTAGKLFFHRTFEFTSVIGAPVFFLSVFDYELVNDCCSDSAFFSPVHRLTIYTIIGICIIAYYYSTLRRRTLAPLIELLINSVLMIGLVLVVAVTIQTDDPFLWLPGTPSIAMFFITQMVINHRLIIQEVSTEDSGGGIISQFCLKLLKANIFIKVPVLLVLAIPVLLLISLLLYVFGQRPDAAIRAFTETYKHGFSQWDYQCENVHCGGHYLCSVAANGHTRVVKPVRVGKRNGHYIICNRQLLVSNAFEELVQERFPVFHRFIRKQYDKVGDSIHRNYEVYSKKWVSDIVYIVMKPAEWFFLVVLYLADRKPEQRIARQYAPWN